MSNNILIVGAFICELIFAVSAVYVNCRHKMYKQGVCTKPRTAQRILQVACPIAAAVGFIVLLVLAQTVQK